MADSIRLQGEPHYKTTVTFGSRVFIFEIRWIASESAWYLDIVGVTAPDLVVRGIKLCGGVDLLEPHGLLDIGELWCVDLTGAARDPDFDSAPNDFILYSR